MGSSMGKFWGGGSMWGSRRNEKHGKVVNQQYIYQQVFVNRICDFFNFFLMDYFFKLSNTKFSPYYLCTMLVPFFPPLELIVYFCLLMHVFKLLHYFVKMFPLSLDSFIWESLVKNNFQMFSYLVIIFSLIDCEQKATFILDSSLIGTCSCQVLVYYLAQTFLLKFCRHAWKWGKVEIKIKKEYVHMYHLTVWKKVNWPVF